MTLSSYLDSNACRLDDEEHIQAAIDSCPVSCIHWVDKSQLAPLEYVMQVRTIVSLPHACYMRVGNVDTQYTHRDTCTCEQSLSAPGAWVPVRAVSGY